MPINISDFIFQEKGAGDHSPGKTGAFPGTPDQEPRAPAAGRGTILPRRHASAL